MHTNTPDVMQSGSTALLATQATDIIGREPQQPKQGTIGFYRPDPSGPKSPNIVLDVRADKVVVYEVRPKMTFTIDLADWMARAEMEADTAAMPTNPRYDPLYPGDDMRARIIRERHAALHDADMAQSMVESVLATFNATR